jgi:hypothetical protein
MMMLAGTATHSVSSSPIPCRFPLFPPSSFSNTDTHTHREREKREREREREREKEKKDLMSKIYEHTTLREPAIRPFVTRTSTG